MEYLPDRFDRYDTLSLTCFSPPPTLFSRGRDPSRGLIRLSTVSPRMVASYRIKCLRTLPIPESVEWQVDEFLRDARSVRPERENPKYRGD